MRLTGQQIAQIREALVETFPTRDSLRAMVRVGLDINLDAVVGGHSLRVVVFNLLTWAESNGQVARLIEGAGQENPGSPRLTQLVVESRTWSALTPAEDARRAHAHGVNQQLLPAVGRHLRDEESRVSSSSQALPLSPNEIDWVPVPAGEFLMGSN